MLPGQGTAPPNVSKQENKVMIDNSSQLKFSIFKITKQA